MKNHTTGRPIATLDCPYCGYQEERFASGPGITGRYTQCPRCCNVLPMPDDECPHCGGPDDHRGLSGTDPLRREWAACLGRYGGYAAPPRFAGEPES